MPSSNTTTTQSQPPGIDSWRRRLRFCWSRGDGMKLPRLVPCASGAGFLSAVLLGRLEACPTNSRLGIKYEFPREPTTFDERPPGDGPFYSTPLVRQAETPTAGFARHCLHSCRLSP